MIIKNGMVRVEIFLYMKNMYFNKNKFCFKKNIKKLIKLLTDYRIPVPVQVPPAIPVDTGTRRRLFAGFRPLSGFGRLRIKSAQHRSISLPESNYIKKDTKIPFLVSFSSFFILFFSRINSLFLFLFFFSLPQNSHKNC